MNWKLLAGLSVGLAGAAIVAATLHSSGTQIVGGQRFAVPDQWLFNNKIAWLPKPESDAFTFHLDPIRKPNEIPPHLVLVESAARVCGNDRVSQIIAVACGRERTVVDVAPPYQKVFPEPDYPDAWDYYAVKASARSDVERLQVAWCTPISPNPARPKGTAICTSVWGLNGLVLSLGFEENELPQLSAMRARATQMLLSWKVQ